MALNYESSRILTVYLSVQDVGADLVKNGGLGMVVQGLSEQRNAGVYGDGRGLVLLGHLAETHVPPRPILYASKPWVSAATANGCGEVFCGK